MDKYNFIWFLNALIRQGRLVFVRLQKTLRKDHEEIILLDSLLYISLCQNLSNFPCSALKCYSQLNPRLQTYKLRPRNGPHLLARKTSISIESSLSFVASIYILVGTFQTQNVSVCCTPTTTKVGPESGDTGSPSPTTTVLRPIFSDLSNAIMIP